ncbi:glycerophosphodiester phosphodiesterase family protein [Rhodobacteraceae bacterium CCMM004]|nr:glycerophosphodiester phosphodiesterase family protein [Rhodobacteraceae bacterium CCMM004]
MTMFDPRPLHERFRDPNGTPGEVFVTAHRGDFLDAGRPALAENSVPGIVRAREIGVDMVEIDVHRIADGSLVVIHDATLDRTTDARGPVADLRRGDVAGIGLVHPATRTPYGTALPLLEEVFAALGPSMMVNVELKSGLDLIGDVAGLADRCGVADQVTIKTNLKDGTDYAEVSRRIAACPGPVDLIPVIVDSRDGLDGFERACRTLAPRCVECVVDYPFGDGGYNLLARRGLTMDGGVLFSPRARRLAAEMNIRLFVNTLYVTPVDNGLHQWNGGRDCELGRAAPDSVYGFWIAHGATVIQTDEAAFVLDWLRRAGFHP